MNLKGYLAVTAILLAGCVSSGGDMVAANKPGKPVSDTVTVWSQGTGLLIMGVRAFEMNNADKISKQPTVLNGISVKNLGTGKVYNISLNDGTAVKILPRGMYCVNSFRTYINVNLSYCRPPYFTILSSEVSNMGFVMLGVNYHSHGDTTRFWPFAFYKYKRQLVQYLTPRGHDVVRDFINKAYPNHKTLDNTLWYSYSQGGIPYALWFDRGGMLHYQANVPSPSADDGTWSVKGDSVKLSVDNGGYLYSGKINGDFMSGIAVDPEYGDRWLWYALRDPSEPVAFNSSSKPKIIYQTGIKYPKDAADKKITGYVKLRFRLPLPSELLGNISPTVYPEAIEVVDSKPSGVFDQAAKDAIGMSMYANAVKNGKRIISEEEETINFDFVNGKPVASYATKLEPIALSPSK